MLRKSLLVLLSLLILAMALPAVAQDSTTLAEGLGFPRGIAFDADGNLYVAASLGGKRGIVKLTPDKQASLEVAGHGLVGLAFAPGRSAILATTSVVHHLSWNIQGKPLLPQET